MSADQDQDQGGRPSSPPSSATVPEHALALASVSDTASDTAIPTLTGTATLSGVTSGDPHFSPRTTASSPRHATQTQTQTPSGSGGGRPTSQAQYRLILPRARASAFQSLCADYPEVLDSATIPMYASKESWATQWRFLLLSHAPDERREEGLELVSPGTVELVDEGGTGTTTAGEVEGVSEYKLSVRGTNYAQKGTGRGIHVDLPSGVSLRQGQKIWFAIDQSEQASEQDEKGRTTLASLMRSKNSEALSDLTPSTSRDLGPVLTGFKTEPIRLDHIPGTFYFSEDQQDRPDPSLTVRRGVQLTVGTIAKVPKEYQRRLNVREEGLRLVEQ